MPDFSIPGSLLERAETVFCRTGLFRPARNRYLRLFEPERHTRRRQWQLFFGQFASRGDLIFDVGANSGDLTAEFLELGARVVAIEPLPPLAQKIRRRYHCRALNVEAVALGGEQREADIHVGRWRGLSTLSSERIADRPELWVDQVRVPVTTLDSLIERHGVPRFIKIDVEGFEHEVLEGLATPVEAMSFEFGIMNSDQLRSCVERLCGLAAYEFNLCGGYDYTFLSSRWLTADELLEAVDELSTTRRDTGDVYARRVHQ